MVEPLGMITKTLPCSTNFHMTGAHTKGMYGIATVYLREGNTGMTLTGMTNGMITGINY